MSERQGRMAEERKMIELWRRKRDSQRHSSLIHCIFSSKYASICVYIKIYKFHFSSFIFSYSFFKKLSKVFVSFDKKWRCDAHRRFSMHGRQNPLWNGGFTCSRCIEGPSKGSLCCCPSRCSSRWRSRSRSGEGDGSSSIGWRIRDVARIEWFEVMIGTECGMGRVGRTRDTSGMEEIKTECCLRKKYNEKLFCERWKPVKRCPKYVQLTLFLLQSKANIEKCAAVSNELINHLVSLASASSRSDIIFSMESLQRKEVKLLFPSMHFPPLLLTVFLPRHWLISYTHTPLIHPPFFVVLSSSSIFAKATTGSFDKRRY